MRALLMALRCEKGDVDGNLARHVELLESAAHHGCDVAVFPEMSLTGSLDPQRHRELALTVESPAVLDLAAATSGTGVAAIFGITELGADTAAHITQVIAAGGVVTGVHRKRFLGEDEDAYTAGTTATTFHLSGRPVGLAICAEAGHDEPFDHAAASGANIVFFCAAPGLYGRKTDEASWREGFAWWESSALGDASRHARRHGLWIALSSQAGATVDEDFPGLAALIGPGGEVVDRLPDWREGTLVVEIPAVA